VPNKLLNRHAALRIEIGQAKDAITFRNAVALDAFEIRIVQRNAHVLIRERIRRNGVFFSGKSFLVNRQMIDSTFRIGRFDVQLQHAFFRRVGNLWPVF
jgi:hypothetical protein